MFRRGRLWGALLLLALALLPIAETTLDPPCKAGQQGAGSDRVALIVHDSEVPEQLVAYRYSAKCEFSNFFFEATGKENQPESFNENQLDVVRGSTCAGGKATFFSLGDGQRGVKLERSEDGTTIIGTLFKIQYEGSTELSQGPIISVLNPKDKLDLGHCFVDLSMIYCPVQPAKINATNGRDYVLLRIIVEKSLDGERLKMHKPPLFFPFRLNHAVLEMAQFDRAALSLAISQKPFNTTQEKQKSAQEGENYAVEHRSLYSLHRRGFLSRTVYPGNKLFGIHSYDRIAYNGSDARGRCAYAFVAGRHETKSADYTGLVQGEQRVCKEMTIYRTPPFFLGNTPTRTVFSGYLPNKENDVRFQPFVQNNTKEIRETFLKMRDWVKEVCNRFAASWDPPVSCSVMDKPLIKAAVACGVLLGILLLLICFLTLYLLVFVRRRRLRRRKHRRERRQQRAQLQRSVMGLPPPGPDEVNVDVDEDDKDKKKKALPVKIYKDLTQASSSDSEGGGVKGGDTKKTEAGQGETAFYSAREQFNLSQSKPHPDAATPDVGTPGAGTPGAGTPGAGTPGAGTPNAGTPAASTPIEGPVPKPEKPRSIYMHPA